MIHFFIYYRLINPIGMSLPRDILSLILSYGSFEKNILLEMDESILITASRMLVGKDKKIALKDALYILSRDYISFHDIRETCSKGILPLVMFLIEASTNDHIHDVRLLFDDAVKNDRIGIGIYEAAKNGHLEVVKFLVGKGASLFDKQEALRKAYSRSHQEIVDFLENECGIEYVQDYDPCDHHH